MNELLVALQIPTSCSSSEDRRSALSVQASSPRDVRCARIPAAK